MLCCSQLQCPAQLDMSKERGPKGLAEGITTLCMQALLRRIQARDPETLPACAIAISNLAAGSPRARAALGAMSGSMHMAEAAADASTGAAHMALLQAMLATSQVLLLRG